MLNYKHTVPFLAIFVFILATRPIEAFDTFWQLQSGKYIWETGNFLYRDTFSLAKDSFRLEHCWLHDLILFALYKIGGLNLLSLIKPALISLCATIIYLWNCKRGGESAFTLPIIILCIIGSEQSWLVRPQLWTFIFSLLYLCIFHIGREKGFRAWILLVPVSFLWANLHAGCIFGSVLVGLFILAEIVRIYQKKTSWTKTSPLFLAGFLSFLVSFINPYGHRIPLSLLIERLSQHDVLTGKATLSWMGNMEVLPPSFDQVPVFYFIMALWTVLILLRIRKIDPAEGIFFIAFAYMGFTQIRHTTLVAMMAGLYMPLAFQDVAKPFISRARKQFNIKKILHYGSFSLLAIYICLNVYWGQIGIGLKENFYPEKASRFILKNHLPQILYNNFDWGGYLMWRLYPEYLVFTDGRGSSLEHFEASIRIDNGMENINTITDKYGINTIITGTCFQDSGGPLKSIEQLINNNSWALIYKDEVAVIFIRKTEQFKHIWEKLQIPSILAYETMISEAKRLQETRFAPPRALRTLGMASMSLGRYKDSLQYYQSYLNQNPENKQVENIVKILKNYVR